MKVVSLNVKGLNAAIGRGLFSWLSRQDADILCLQELSCRIVPALFQKWTADSGYHAAILPRSKGREGGGVAILSKTPLVDVSGFDHPTLGPRGQYIVATTQQGIRVASVYVRYRKTEEEITSLQECFNDLRNSKHAIICGDFNIINDLDKDSHLRYDETLPGYRPFERVWFRQLLDEWTDVIPRFTEPLYTWWFSAMHFERNHGTRVDYQLASRSLAVRVKGNSPFIVRDARISDHAPILVDYDVDSITIATPSIAS